MARCCEKGCDNRTRAMGARCRTCKFAIRRAFKALHAAGATVEWVGGAWWAFTQRGEVIACRDGKFACARAAAEGAPMFEGDDAGRAQVFES